MKIMEKFLKIGFNLCFVILFLKIKGYESMYLTCDSSESTFPCDDYSLCIKPSWWCDGGRDCGDGSDEQYCGLGPGNICNTSLHFNCYTGRCIPKVGRCDGINSCVHNSDERDCAPCPSNKFTCNSSDCILSEKQCDGVEDCMDGSDEFDCVRCPGQFSCNKTECINLEMHCDGSLQCSDGSDEFDCEHFIFSEENVGETRWKAIEWLKKQRSGDSWWKENTHRAVVALDLAGSINFQDSNNELDLMSKQMELQMTTFLLRQKTQKITATQLSMFINSLLVICHDPYHFYGLNLVNGLKERIGEASGYMHPLPYLTLCSLKETISENAVKELLQMAQSSSKLGFVLEIQAAAILSLSCIVKETQYAYLKPNVTAVVNILKKEQWTDGSFGNLYTTALVVQALIANNHTVDTNWTLNSGIDFLKKSQKTDGSFGDFLTTYFILPILKGKTLADIKNVNCTGYPRIKRDKTLIDIKNKLGNRVYVKFSAIVGDDKEQIHPISLKIPENSTVTELLTIAAAADSKYKFKTHKIRGENYIYEILGIPNDPEDSLFWIIYKDTEDGLTKESAQSPDKVFVHPEDQIVMWYKTLDFL